MTPPGSRPDPDARSGPARSSDAGDGTGPGPSPSGNRRYVLGIGHATLDRLVVVDRFPEPDSKQETPAPMEEGGGPVATAMVTAARLGVPARIVAVVGDDPTGRRIREGLDAEGVDTSALRSRAGCRSAESIVLVEPETGRRTILWNRGGGAPLEAQEIPPGLVEGALALLVDGHHPEAQYSAVERASRAGVPVVLDAGSVRPATRRLLPLVDHAIVSEGFARDWSGPDHDAALLAIRDAGPGAAVITLGERGCVGRTGDGRVALPALPVGRADTNGAGDVFHGAYVAGLAVGLAFRDRLLLANAAAGLQCRTPGPRAGIPGLEEALAAAGL